MALNASLTLSGIDATELWKSGTVEAVIGSVLDGIVFIGGTVGMDSNDFVG